MAGLGGVASMVDEPNADYKNLMGMLNQAYRAAGVPVAPKVVHPGARGHYAGVREEDEEDDSGGWGSGDDETEDGDEDLSSSAGASGGDEDEDEDEELVGSEPGTSRAAGGKQQQQTSMQRAAAKAGAGAAAGQDLGGTGPVHRGAGGGPEEGEDGLDDDDGFNAALMAGVGEDFLQGYYYFGGEGSGEEEEGAETGSRAMDRVVAAVADSADEPEAVVGGGAHIGRGSSEGNWPQGAASSGAGAHKTLEAVMGEIDWADVELTSQDMGGEEGGEEAGEQEVAGGRAADGGAGPNSAVGSGAVTGAAEGAGPVPGPAVQPVASSDAPVTGLSHEGDFTSLLHALRHATEHDQLDVRGSAAGAGTDGEGAAGPSGVGATARGPLAEQQGRGEAGAPHLPDGRLLEPFAELAPGEPRPKGRLGALYAALAANRAVSGYLRGTLLPRLDRALEANWRHTAAVRAAPEAQKLYRAEAQRAPLITRDPIRQIARGGQQQELRRFTRHWVVDGEAPAPNQDTLTLATQLSAFPSTYERTRWSTHLMQRLRTGVEVEVRAQMTQSVLDEAQAAAAQVVGTAGEQVGAAAAAAAGQAPSMAHLTARFTTIEAITADSPEAVEAAARFTDEQWSRISHVYVKDRSPVDCKVFWLHSMAVSKAWSEEEMRRLQQLVAQLGQQAWGAVARELGNGRTPAQCVRQWLKSARPAEHAAKGRTRWEPEDCALLAKLVAEHGTNWVKISAAFNGKFDRHQVRDRWHGQASQKHQRNIGRWSPEEDDLLKQAVASVGRQWRMVSAQVGSRTAQQCRERYENVLNPSVTSGPFTEEEVAALRKAVGEVEAVSGGRIQWSKVAQRMPTKRTDDMCKRAWLQLESKGEVTVGKAGQPAASTPKRARSGGKGTTGSGAPRAKAAKSRLGSTPGTAAASALDTSQGLGGPSKVSMVGPGGSAAAGAGQADVQAQTVLEPYPQPLLLPAPMAAPPAPPGMLGVPGAFTAGVSTTGPGLAATAALVAQAARAVDLPPLPVEQMQADGQLPAPRRSSRARQATRHLADFEDPDLMLRRMATPKDGPVEGQ